MLFKVLYCPPLRLHRGALKMGCICASSHHCVHIGLLMWHQLHKLSDILQNDRVGETSSKVSDSGLILTYFSRSNRSVKGLLVVRYQLHKSSDQLQSGIVDASWNVSHKFKGQWPSPFLSTFQTRSRSPC